ncbi:hypothetical protein ABW16_05465 [Mycolicibacter heraklionensis]|uniref:Uncharacterized protein n=1 Tax=Mycolicibacter heraklionensis TaxID=512402 RepID=A0ABR5FHZ6_9MYCO|nr:hypothetical protein [Mycolicibacter heraklionensis]KLO30372.1 hypothetical protein ABW16_05465 [Mycolicibacter heraklionensis]
MLTVGGANWGNAPLVHHEWPPAARIAVEVFLEFMRQNRVRPYDIAARCRIRSLTRHVPVGPRREIVHSFDLTPPFWPLTIDPDDARVTGYGIDRTGACIRYAQNPYPLANRADEETVLRVQFAPGCHNLMRRATRTNPAFICEPLPSWHAVQIITEYLIDAAISLSEGRGPVAARTTAPSHTTR